MTEPHAPSEAARSVEGLPELGSDDASYVASLGQALGNPVRARIVALLAGRGSAVSPKQVTDVLGVAGLGTISYHFRYLRERGFVVLVHTVPRRGALEHFYGLQQPLGEAVRLLVADLPEGPAATDGDGEMTAWAAEQIMRRGKALGYPLRAHIAAFLLHNDETSATIASTALADSVPQASVSTVAYHMRVLEKHGFLRMTKTAPARGSFMKYYALRPAMRAALVAVAGTVDARYAALAAVSDDGPPDDLACRFGCNLRHAREGAGRTAVTVAENCGITVDDLRRIEAGHLDPDSRLLAALADAVGLAVSNLYD